MAFKYYKTFEHDGIAVGGTVSGSWTADEDLVIKRIHIIRKDGAQINRSTLYLKIADKVYSREVIPVALMARGLEYTAEVNLEFKLGEKLDYTFKNLEDVAIGIYIAMEVHAKG